MTKKTTVKPRKGTGKTRVKDLDPKRGQEPRGGKATTVTTRRQDPYKNFNF